MCLETTSALWWMDLCNLILISLNCVISSASSFVLKYNSLHPITFENRGFVLHFSILFDKHLSLWLENVQSKLCLVLPFPVLLIKFNHSLHADIFTSSQASTRLVAMNTVGWMVCIYAVKFNQQSSQAYCFPLADNHRCQPQACILWLLFCIYIYECAHIYAKFVVYLYKNLYIYTNKNFKGKVNIIWTIVKKTHAGNSAFYLKEMRFWVEKRLCSCEIS